MKRIYVILLIGLSVLFGICVSADVSEFSNSDQTTTISQDEKAAADEAESAETQTDIKTETQFEEKSAPVLTKDYINEDAFGDAIADANASAFPMVWAVSGFLSSCLLAPVGSVLVNLALISSNMDLPGANIYASSAMCCLGATLISYFSTPTVPGSGTRGKSTSYKEKYRETYTSTLKNKNTLYTFAGGAIGFLVSSVSVFALVMTMFFPY